LVTQFRDGLFNLLLSAFSHVGRRQYRELGISQEQMTKLERQMGNLQGQYKLVERTYGQDVLNLVLA